MATRRVRFLVCAAALLVVMAQAPAWAAPKKTAKPDPNATLVTTASSNVPDILDPQKYTGGGAGTMLYTAAYDRLMQLNLQNELVPMLATTWKFDSTGKVLTFNLRKDVKFQ